MRKFEFQVNFSLNFYKKISTPCLQSAKNFSLKRVTKEIFLPEKNARRIQDFENIKLIQLKLGLAIRLPSAIEAEQTSPAR